MARLRLFRRQSALQEAVIELDALHAQERPVMSQFVFLKPEFRRDPLLLGERRKRDGKRKKLLFVYRSLIDPLPTRRPKNSKSLLFG